MQERGGVVERAQDAFVMPSSASARKQTPFLVGPVGLVAVLGAKMTIESHFALVHGHSQTAHEED